MKRSSLPKLNLPMKNERIKKFLFREDRGAMAVEGIIIMTMLIFFLVFLMSFGFLLYQQWAVVYAANDAATRTAQSYAYPNTDPVMGFINSSMKASLSPYRYLSSNLKEGNVHKAEAYARWSLERGSLATAVDEPEIVVETVYDGFAQRHVVVDITATYEIPFGLALEFFGMDSTVTYHATGRAACMDVSDYIYSVNAAKSLADQTLGSKVAGAVNKVLGLISNVIDALED